MIYGIVAGLWGLVMMALLIQAIRLSYAIEARSEKLANRSGFPRNAMLHLTILNIGVAGDAETQAMRRKMNIFLLINLVGIVALAAAIMVFTAAPEATAPGG